MKREAAAAQVKQQQMEKEAIQADNAATLAKLTEHDSLVHFLEASLFSKRVWRQHPLLCGVPAWWRQPTIVAELTAYHFLAHVPRLPWQRTVPQHGKLNTTKVAFCGITGHMSILQTCWSLHLVRAVQAVAAGENRVAFDE